MFGISPLGWVHTLGSLPAIPLAIYMFVPHGRIVPRSVPGALYFVSMLIGGTTVFLVAREPISYGIGAATILLLVAGYACDEPREIARARVSISLWPSIRKARSDANARQSGERHRGG